MCCDKIDRDKRKLFEKKSVTHCIDCNDFKKMTPFPEDIQSIGQEIAIRWEDGSESYYTFEFLRKHSPSAENIGEKDILGNQYGGNGPKEFPNVRVEDWQYVGNYAIRFRFSDGHNTGIYSWEYLRELEKKQ